MCIAIKSNKIEPSARIESLNNFIVNYKLGIVIKGPSCRFNSEVHSFIAFSTTDKLSAYLSRTGAFILDEQLLKLLFKVGHSGLTSPF